MPDGKDPTFRGFGIFFRPIEHRHSQHLSIFLSRRSLAFVLLGSVLFLLLNPLRLEVHLALWQRMLFWSFTISIFITCYIGFTLLWSYGQFRFRLPRIYLPLFGFLGFGVALAVMLNTTAILVGVPLRSLTSPGRAMIAYSVVLVFEALYYTFVLPGFEETRQKPAPDAPSRRLAIADQSFALDEILYLLSQAHHVEIVTETGSHRVRARMGDLVSQTRTEDGVMAHRSHWIARQAIERFEPGTGNDFLALKNGDRLPVARPRRAKVLKWICEHRPEIAPPQCCENPEMT